MSENVGNHKIKFKHGLDGMIETSNGNTIFADLLMVGALACTREYTHGSSNENFHGKYQTDVDGLVQLSRKTQEGVKVIADIVTTLGVLMAGTDLDNLDRGDVSRFAWLISGLGELQGQLVFENAEVNYALNNCKVMYEKGLS